MTMKQQVFISYSRKDKTFIDILRNDLANNGFDVWIDVEGLKVGTKSWERALREAIKESFAFILIASPASNDSPYVRDELRIAQLYDVAIIPVFSDGEHFIEVVPMGYGEYQYADLREDKYQQGLNGLRDSLMVLLDSQSEPVVQPDVPDDYVPQNPYKGLRPFREEDAGEFFGRDTLIEELLDKLKNNPRFLAIVGPSGSGKSSIAMAGLIPRLRAGALQNSENWLYLEQALPGSNPIEELMLSLPGVEGMSMASIEDELKQSIRSLYLIGRKLARQGDKRIVLLIDQFEELFTQTADESIRRQFLDIIYTAVTEMNSPWTIILTLRADFYDKPLNYSDFGNLLDANSKGIVKMTTEELRSVIEEPAIQEKLQFEANLIGDILFELPDDSGALPLLQFMLDQLFQKHDGLVLRHSAYTEIGGVQGALAQHAETSYNNLSDQTHKDMARALFVRLVEPGATERETTRRRTPLSELETGKANSEQRRTVQEIFVNARLLITHDNTIEVIHEALIREWKRLGNWITEAYRDIHLQHSISRDTEKWYEEGQPESDYLYSGARLIEALDWLRRQQMDLYIVSEQEETFIQASENYQKEQSIFLESYAEQSRELEEERDRKDMLYQMTSGLARTLDMEQLLERSLGMVSKAVGAHDGVIMLSDPATDNLYSRAWINPNNIIYIEDEDVNTHPAEGLAEWLIHDDVSGDDVVLVDDLNEEKYWNEKGRETGLRSALAVMLKNNEDLMGVMVLMSKEVAAFTENHLKLLVPAANEVAKSINSADLYQLYP